jgi:hypothetical protein
MRLRIVSAEKCLTVFSNDLTQRRSGQRTVNNNTLIGAMIDDFPRGDGRPKDTRARSV